MSSMLTKFIYKLYVLIFILISKYIFLKIICIFLFIFYDLYLYFMIKNTILLWENNYFFIHHISLEQIILTILDTDARIKVFW